MVTLGLPSRKEIHSAYLLSEEAMVTLTAQLVSSSPHCQAEQLQ